MGPIQISGSAANVPAMNNNATLLEGLNPYTPHSWAFGTVLPEWFAIYSIQFSDKYIQPGGPYPAWSGRSNAVILYGLTTVHSHESPVTFPAVPLLCPPGFKIHGAFGNNSPEAQNMICIVSGFLYDGDWHKLPGMPPATAASVQQSAGPRPPGCAPA